MPWVIDREYRGEWPDEPRTEHALIAHIDPDRLKAGEVVWSLVYVDLTVAAEGVKAVQAAEAYLAAPKFKHADVAAAPAGDAGTPPAPSRTAGAGGDQPKARPSASPTAQMVAAQADRREALRERRRRMRTNAASLGWLAEFDAQWTAAGIGKDSTDDEVEAALNAIEPPFDTESEPVAPTVDARGLRGRRWDCYTDEVRDVELQYEIRTGHDGAQWLHLLNGPTGYESAPLEDLIAKAKDHSEEWEGWNACAGTPRKWDRLVVTRESILSEFATTAPDNGGPVDQADIKVLLAAVRSSDVRAVVNGWLRQGNLAGASWDPRYHPDVRRYEITRAALALAVATDGDDAVARVMIGHAINWRIASWTDVGTIIGFLDITEAKRLTALAEALGPQLGLRYDADGQPHLDGDVAAVLRNVA